MNKNVDSISRIFSIKLREIMAKILPNADKLQEIRLRSGQPLLVLFDNREKIISENGEFVSEPQLGYIVTNNEIRETMEYISNYSMYAFEEEVKQGFITVSGGHRIGICGKVVLQEGKIRTIKYISFINIRIAHEIIGCSDSIMNGIYKNRNEINNTLIISPPGLGKTTLLRDVVRNISNGGVCCNRGMKVGIADERSEIAACYLGIPQNNVGLRTDVLDGVPKAIGIMMLIRTMSPEVIAVDEIGSEEDIQAIRNGLNCGCRFICTVHGDSVQDIMNKLYLKQLIREKMFTKYILINGKERANRYTISGFERVMI